MLKRSDRQSVCTRDPTTAELSPRGGNALHTLGSCGPADNITLPRATRPGIPKQSYPRSRPFFVAAAGYSSSSRSKRFFIEPANNQHALAAPQATPAHLGLRLNGL